MISFFESKNYTLIMFLAITLTSIILLFTFVDFVQDVNEGVTAYAIAQQNPNQQQTQTNITAEQEQGEIYTMQAWSIFYVAIGVIIILVGFLSVVLKRTVQKNIKDKEKNQEGMV
tara:strand:- start:1464 stop:1808 length:345 start_codon:yes stop_codon:yes gene_type:complete